MPKSLAYLTKLSSYLFFFPRKNKAPHNAHLNLVKYCLLLLNCVQHQTRVTVSFPFHHPTPWFKFCNFPLFIATAVYCVEATWTSLIYRDFGCVASVAYLYEAFDNFLAWLWLCWQPVVYFALKISKITHKNFSYR